MKSRVLFIDHTGELGGAELMLLDIAQAYRETSTVVLLADGPFKDQLKARDIKVHMLPGREALHAVRRDAHGVSLRASAEAFRLALKIVPLARQHDCLHANTQKSFAIACLAGAIARRPVIWDLHDLLAPAQFSSRHIKLDVMLANRWAKAVLANSQASADALVNSGGHVRKIHVIHNGIDHAPFDAVTDAEIAEARAEFGITDVPAIGLFGRLSEWKGQHVALNALAQMPGVHLLIVGDALFGEVEYARQLRQQVEELRLSERVHFAGFRSDIPRLMRAVDVVVHTSIAPEPFGRVVVEGMLARRPVVATRGGGVDEILVPGVTGLTVAPGNPSMLAAAVQELFANPGRRLTMAHAARKAAREQFSVAAMVEKVTYQIERVSRQ